MFKPWLLFAFLLNLCVVLCLSKKELLETGLFSKATRIIKPPQNTTVLENTSVKLSCGATRTPNNITYNWYHNGILISELPWLALRTDIKSDGSLVIQPTTANDTGKFTCNATDVDTVFVYLRVDHPARVIFSPARQYLPLGLSGTVKCYVEASPPVLFVIWFKDLRPFDPSTQPNVQLLTNGSLYFSEITRQQEGYYTCKPYNINGIERGSNPMEVLVRDPSEFKVQEFEDSKKINEPSIIEITNQTRNISIEKKTQDNNTVMSETYTIVGSLSLWLQLLSCLCVR